MPVQLMTSPLIKQKREKMSSQFTSLMLTSNERRDQLSKNEKAAKTKFNKKKVVNYKDEIFMESIGIESEHISRVGFVFVC
jgi:vacuolar-type H+-ATPase subunit D/Vma8